MRSLSRPVCGVFLGLVVALVLGQSAWAGMFFGPVLDGPVLAGPLPFGREKTTNVTSNATSLLFKPISQGGSVLDGPQPTPATLSTGTTLGGAGIAGEWRVPASPESVRTEPSTWIDESGSGGTTIQAGTGGTDVDGGTLIVNNQGSLETGSSLTVGARASFIFDPPALAAPLVLSSALSSNLSVTSDSSDSTSGAILNGGTLVLQNDPVWELESCSLTVGAGGVFIFDPSTSSSPTSSLTASPVPEPSTLVLLAIAAGSVYFRRLRRR